MGPILQGQVNDSSTLAMGFEDAHGHLHDGTPVDFRTKGVTVPGDRGDEVAAGTLVS